MGCMCCILNKVTDKQRYLLMNLMKPILFLSSKLLLLKPTTNLIIQALNSNRNYTANTKDRKPKPSSVENVQTSIIHFLFSNKNSWSKTECSRKLNK